MSPIYRAFLRRHLPSARDACVAGLLVLGACSNGMPEAMSVGGAGGADAASAAGSTDSVGGAGTSGAAGNAGTTGAVANAGSGGAAGSAGGSAAGGIGGMGGMAGVAGVAGVAGSAGAGGAAGAIDAGTSGGARPPATSLMLPTTMESGEAEPWFNIYRPTDLTATGQPLPVIVWANGGCYRSDFTWAPLFERWAADGFVVLALTASPTEGELVQTNVDHHGALIDWALDHAPFADMLDRDRIVAAGNSCGGITALALASRDDRVAAVFVLSGSSAFAGADTAVINGISVPVGYVVGGSEDIASANASADYDALADGIPAMIVNRSSGDHVTVSTDTTVLPQVAEIALEWMDLALYGTHEAATALTAPNVCASCEPSMWTLKSKNLDKLEQ